MIVNAIPVNFLGRGLLLVKRPAADASQGVDGAYGWSLNENISVAGSLLTDTRWIIDQKVSRTSDRIVRIGNLSGRGSTGCVRSGVSSVSPMVSRVVRAPIVSKEALIIEASTLPA